MDQVYKVLMMRVAPIKAGYIEPKKPYVPPTDSSYQPKFEPESFEEVVKVVAIDLRETFLNNFRAYSYVEQKKLLKDLKSIHIEAKELQKDVQAEIDEILSIFCQ